jgi:secreted trypsin-like serine protease
MKYYDPKSQFCAGYKDTAGISLCWGDSGGPAFVLQNGDWELVGVTSWSNYCGFPNEFSYFTDVQKLHNWIECEAWKLQQL